jgi:phosphoglycolate phosphatase
MFDAEAVYFDLDGTLTDPKLGITRSIRYALDQLGHPAPQEEDLIWCIGPPLRASLASFVGEADADRALFLYRERFSDIGLFENQVYPGIPELLSALSGRRLFVATSKPRIYAERILSHFKMTEYFERIFGSELDGTRTDKSELLAHALQTTEGSPSRSVMVGDRKHDVIGARANGITGLGVLYGYGDEEELRQAGATQLFATPEELKQAFERSITD